MTRKHGVTDEDVRRDEQNDDRNYRNLKEGAAEGGCCLLEFFAAATCLAGLVLISLLVR